MSYLLNLLGLSNLTFNELLWVTFGTFGQLIFTMGGYQKNYDVMLAGRIIFGCGGECMGVA